MPVQPILLCPPQGELHLKYANYFRRFENDPDCAIVMHVTSKEIATLNVSQIHEKLIVLQHYPHLIKRFLIGVEFRFEHPQQKRMMFDWELINPLVIAWFKMLLEFPAVPFFVKDNQLRFFMIGGEFVLTRQYQAKIVPGVPGFDMILDSRVLNILTDRLFISARFLQLYVYGLNIDPEKEVDEVLKGINLILRYSMIKKHLEGDLAYNLSTNDGKFRFN